MIFYLFRETLNNLTKIKGSLQKDVLLQRGIAYLMEVKDFPEALKIGCINESLLVNMIANRMKIHQSLNYVVRWTKFF